MLDKINKLRNQLEIYESKLNNEKNNQLVCQTKLEQYSQEKEEIIEQLNSKGIDAHSLEELCASKEKELQEVFVQIESLLNGESIISKTTSSNSFVKPKEYINQSEDNFKPMDNFDNFDFGFGE